MAGKIPYENALFCNTLYIFSSEIYMHVPKRRCVLEVLKLKAHKKTYIFQIIKNIYIVD